MTSDLKVDSYQIIICYDCGRWHILELHTYAVDLNKIGESLDSAITDQYSFAIPLQYHLSTITGNGILGDALN